MNLPPHVTWLGKRFEEPLLAALKLEQIENISIEDVLSTVCAADPSPGKKAVDWLIKGYIRGWQTGEPSYRWEDIVAGQDSKVYETLVWFAEHRKNLVGAQRNLADYKSLGEVYTAISPFLQDSRTMDNGEASGKELRRQERLQVLQETIEVWRSPDLIVAVPLTERASCWWGKGTRWCTAATPDENSTNQNYFHSYNQDAPLIVVLFPQGLSSPEVQQSLDEKAETVGVRKFQMWVTKSNFQFMDEHDNSVKPEFILEHWQQFKPLLEWTAQNFEGVYSLFPLEDLTEEQLIKAIQYNVNTPNRMSKVQFTPEICKIIVEQSPVSFQFIPESLRTEEFDRWAFETNPCYSIFNEIKTKTQEMWFEFCKTDIFLFREMPLEYQTKEICQIVLSKNPALLANIRVDLLDEEMIVQAITDYPMDSFQYEKIPEKFRTETVLKVLLENYPEQFRNISAEHITHTIRLTAVKLAPDNIRYMNDSDITPEIITAALEKDPYIVTIIPRSKISSEMLKTALDRNSYAIRSIPEQLKTPEICLYAIKFGGASLNWIPQHLWTPELLEAAVEKSPVEAVRYIPAEQRTYDMCMRAFELNNSSIMFFRDEWITPELFKQAFLSGSINTRLVPPHLVKQNLLQEWITINPRLIDKVCRDHQKEELCVKAVTLNPNALYAIHTSRRTLAVCLAALKSNDIIFSPSVIPDELVEQVHEHLKQMAQEWKLYDEPKLVEREQESPVEQPHQNEKEIPVANWDASYLSGLRKKIADNFLINESTRCLTMGM